MAGEREGRSASVRGWIEAIGVAVAAVAAVVTVVVTQRDPNSSSGAGDVLGSSKEGSASSITSVLAAPMGAVEAIRSFFVADNGGGCVDITDTVDSEPGRLAVLGCTVAGGEVRLDLSQFDSSSTLSDYFSRIRSAVGGDGIVKSWHLGGNETPTTGSTLEFIASGNRATILWTYDAHGMAAMASRNDDNQAELNRWWSTIGSLVEDDVAPEVIAGR